MAIPPLNPRLAVITSCAVSFLLFAIYQITVYSRTSAVQSPHAGANHQPPSPCPAPPPPPPPPPPPTLEQLINDLFRPIKHPDFFQNFVDASGKVFQHNNTLWKEPLGKDLLIVDVDTRYPEKMFDASKSVDWESLKYEDTITEAVFNHYLYAKIHGYDYHFYKPERVEGHHKTWPKVHSLAALLPNYRFVVFLDADASFRHLSLPLEWLFNRWGITSRTSFAMARDPLNEDCNLCDSFGVPMMNTGFVIAQNLEYTREIFDMWMKCTSGTLEGYEGCGKWREEWAHEQSVFSDYIRRDFNPDGDNIVQIECGDANGFPGHPWYDPVKCNGEFIRHHTFVKDMTKTTTSNALMQAMMGAMREGLAGQARELVLDEGQKKKAEEEAKMVVEAKMNMEEQRRKKVEEEKKEKAEEAKKKVEEEKKAEEEAKKVVEAKINIEEQRKKKVEEEAKKKEEEEAKKKVGEEKDKENRERV